MRLLGIDYGSKRIGVAIGDTETRVAMPLRQIDGRNEPTRDARLVANAGQAECADAFVVGLPLSMDGTNSEQTRLTRRFAAELERLSGKAVHLQDERLSSYAAEESLSGAGLSPAQQKQRTDAVAAARILQMYLDGRPPDEKNVQPLQG